MKSILNTAPRSIFVLFNCQNQMLIQALQRLLPDTKVTGMSTNQFSSRQKRGELKKKVNADAFVFLPNGRAILGDHPCVDLLPDVAPIEVDPIIFRGFHPDSAGVPKHSGNVALLGGLHSKIVHRGFQQDKSEAEIVADFNEDTYRALGYFDVFRTEQKRMLEQFAKAGLDLGPAYNNWMRDSIFMRTTNHPKAYVVFDLAVALCKREGWRFDPDHARHWRSMAEDFLLNNINWPVYPELAEELGFEGSHLFRMANSERLLSLPEFVRHEVNCFKEAAT